MYLAAQADSDTADMTIVTERRRFKKLFNLSSQTDYAIHVWAVTSAGHGPSKSAVATTTHFAGFTTTVASDTAVIIIGIIIITYTASSLKDCKRVALCHNYQMRLWK